MTRRTTSAGRRRRTSSSCNLSDDGRRTWAHTPRATTVRASTRCSAGSRCPTRPASPAPKVLVSFHRGFTADLGGGEYDRASTLDDELRPLTHVPTDEADLQTAVDDLAGGGRGRDRRQRRRYSDSLAIDAARERTHRAARRRPAPARAAADAPTSRSPATTDSEVTLNGLLIVGGAIVVDGDVSRVSIRHCTLVPGLDVQATARPSGRRAEPRRQRRRHVRVDDRALDPRRASAPTAERSVEIARQHRRRHRRRRDRVRGARRRRAGREPHARAARRSSAGSTRTSCRWRRTRSSSPTRRRRGDWTAPVRVEQRQEGCVRFSYVPPESRQCRAATAASPEPTTTRPRAAAFTSLRYGDAGYCQLDARCPAEIRAGADDESEMGAFHDSSSRSGRRTCARGSTNTCASAWRPGSSMRPEDQGGT